MTLSPRVCASTSAATSAPATPVPTRELSREQAISFAYGDAARSLRMTDVASVSVTRTGAFWVVDLYGQRGNGVRYAITAADGTIRERRWMQ